jgi:hypothetical protein
MPTDEQLKQYVDRLPSIYRVLLALFPKVAPRRREGDGLALDTILDVVVEDYPDQRMDDVEPALDKLEEQGFVAVNKQRTHYAPTPLGERLIATITGEKPAPAGPPPLPVPSWVNG